MNKLKSAADEAREIFRNQIKVPRLYLEAFRSTQKLEVYLKWIWENYIKGIQNLLEKENRYFYEKVNIAIEKRNDFIHNCFKVKTKKGIGIILDQNAFHLNTESLEKLQLWINAFDQAEPVILSVLANSWKIKGL